MKGAKALDGRRVRLTRDITTKGGTRFAAGEIVTFKRAGVVRCALEADDGRRVAGNLSREDFIVLEEPVAPAGRAT